MGAPRRPLMSDGHGVNFTICLVAFYKMQLYIIERVHRTFTHLSLTRLSSSYRRKRKAEKLVNKFECDKVLVRPGSGGRPIILLLLYIICLPLVDVFYFMWAICLGFVPYNTRSPLLLLAAAQEAPLHSKQRECDKNWTPQQNRKCT